MNHVMSYGLRVKGVQEKLRVTSYELWGYMMVGTPALASRFNLIYSVTVKSILFDLGNMVTT